MFVWSDFTLLFVLIVIFYVYSFHGANEDLYASLNQLKKATCVCRAWKESDMGLLKLILDLNSLP